MYFVRNNEEIHLSFKNFKNSQKLQTQALNICYENPYHHGAYSSKETKQLFFFFFFFLWGGEVFLYSIFQYSYSIFVPAK